MNDSSQIKKIDLNKVDWQSSKDFFESLADDLRSLDDKDEKYDFTWVGKRKAIIEAGAPINKTLRPDEKSSRNWDNTENLFIEGDNLDALKLLQESYLGKVKMIYIDPPYNTGKDFVYRDNFKANVEEYDEATEYKDGEGNIQYKKNEKSNGRYHSDWLSMMYPRLKLSRNLLSTDGAIFVSIDDNEMYNLKKLMDYIFGDENYVGIFTVENNPKGRKNSKFISVSNDFCLVYAQNLDHAEFNSVMPKPASDMEEDENGNFVRKSGKRVLVGENTLNPFVKNFNSGKHYSVYFNKSTNDLLAVKEERLDQINQELIDSGYKRYISYNGDKFTENTYSENQIIEMHNENKLDIRESKIYEKHYSDKIQIKSVLTNTKYEAIIDNNKIAYILDLKTTSAKQDLAELMGGNLFDFPKNISFIKTLIELNTDANSLVLDFFSGSGTTAHAVMQLNSEDGGNRKWIMVQLPEEAPEGSEAQKAGYATISEIARERIRRAGDKIAKDHPYVKVDYGFRSLVIADTNYKEVYKPVSEVSQESLLDTVDNIKEDRTALDLLYGVLTQLALELNRPIETRDVVGSVVYLYDYFGEVSGLAACFSNHISEEAIKHIAALKPLTAVFKDSSFADSQAKVNLAEHFRVMSPDTKVRVI
jgi:adenine-specific DNA-methyltransferase